MPLLSSLFDAPSRWTALDPVAARAKDVADRLLPGGSVRALLHGRPAGHPAHPALAQLPIGTSVSALLLDAVATVTPGGAALEAPARGLAAVSVAAVAPTALAGWADYVDLHPDQQRTAIVHAAGNALAAALWTASLFSRRHGRLLRTAGTSVAGAAGALGGHLAYRWAAGPNHAEHLVHLAGDGKEFSDLGPLDDLPEGRPALRRIGDAPLCVLRRGGQVLALTDTCTHLGAALHEGEVKGTGAATTITCPWHGSEFRFADGDVLDGPATAPQPTVETKVADGRVLARVVGPPL
ncbi:Rieske 2Fe-2S domain-containing protein [Kineococcus rhizosphaerae]|uniref:Nitrite reductase/ring-hydroxylating ferredoxin subunit n=1 Tax=Kineococcus rhizosphaerae TaxID=559628 RepID=A0A2T0R3A3_9ACTN|nr:Rieske (2Fe-2S) protein [Kineococcus rhizosphaerae]PRY14548.1 nitrite reductase/ring-hydroxylating ferredoxin subunit [Kineococcus rhizosphaerae]